MKMRKLVGLAGVGALALSGSPAWADFAHPLDTVPKPQVVVAFDTSVTMGITPDCGSCHSNGFHPATRLSVAKTDILATLPMFRDYFVYGGFRYSGCNYAKIDARVLPNPNNPDASYASVSNMISGAGHCNQRENYFPGGAAQTGGCITPTEQCTGDEPVLTAILTGGLPGLAIPAPVSISPVICDRPGSPIPSFNLQAALLARLGGGTFTWPRWGPGLNSSQVNTDLCNPLRTILDQIRTDIESCLADPTQLWDLSGIDLGWGTWCQGSLIASTACTVSSLVGTCVCDGSQPGCASLPIPTTECGNVMTWKARQQVAVCETYSQAGPNRFGTFFRNQPDNIINPGGCRENVALLFTDGYMGHRAGVAVEANGARSYYRSAAGLSNMFVFRVSGVFNSEANAMMNYVSQGLYPTAFNATDRPTMQESFAKVLNRVFKGVYNGSRVGMDSFQTRMAVHSFTVPGYNATGPVSDNYLGFPSRISWYEVQANGAISSTPIFESDWTSKVTAAPGCGPINVNFSAGEVPRIGPGGNFRNGVARTVSIAANTIDRDGDGTVDNHPPLRWGRSFGFAASKPVVVEAPREAQSTHYATDFFAHQQATRTRPRIIYYTDGGYLIGIHGGVYSASVPAYGGLTRSFGYDDSVPAAGAEVFRFRPTWINAAQTGVRYNYAINDLVQQPLITGELTAREVRVRVGGTDQWRTVLVGNQGKDGPGYFAVDITNPCAAPAFHTSWTLPAGNYASAAPAVYTFPMAAEPRQRSVVITTGGLGGTPTLYAYDLVNGALLATRALTGGGANQSYPTQPVCVDVSGEGYVTHCYILREDGYLARVPVVTGGFGPPADVTPMVGADRPSMTGGQRYYSAPAVFFGADGAVNVAFGSGDYRNLTAPSGPTFVYRMRDIGSRQNGLPAQPGQLANVCAPVGGNSSGVFPLGPGERLLTSPVVEGGVVAWSTYRSETTGCVSGISRVYAMDYQTCYDVMNPAASPPARPTARNVGLGLPSEPVLHRTSQQLLVQTSASPTADQTFAAPVRAKGGGRPWSKFLYWRLELDNP